MRFLKIFLTILPLFFLISNEMNAKNDATKQDQQDPPPLTQVTALIGAALSPANDKLVRWEGEMRVGIGGDFAYNVYPMLVKVARAFDNVTEFEINTSWETFPNFVVLMSSDPLADIEGKYNDLLTSFVFGELAVDRAIKNIEKAPTACHMQFRHNAHDGIMTGALLFMHTDIKTHEIYGCLYSSFIRSIGLVTITDPLTYQAVPKNVAIAEHHKALIDLLYSPKLNPGMGGLDIRLTLRPN